MMPWYYIHNVNTTLKLIDAVKKRPQLWNKNLPDYNASKDIKLRLWDEISEVIEPDFKNKSFAERLHIRRMMQRRWKSLRDCFTRELSKKKKLDSGALVTYKPYVYFKNLGFLLDVTDNGDNLKKTVYLENFLENEKPVTKDVFESQFGEVSEYNNAENKTGVPKVSYVTEQNNFSNNVNKDQEISVGNIDNNLETGTLFVKNLDHYPDKVESVTASKILKIINKSLTVSNNKTTNKCTVGKNFKATSSIKGLPRTAIYNINIKNNNVSKLKRNHSLLERIHPETSEVPSTITESNISRLLVTDKESKNFCKTILSKNMNNNSNVVIENKIDNYNNDDDNKEKLQFEPLTDMKKVNKIHPFPIGYSRLRLKNRILKRRLMKRYYDEDKLFLLSLVKELKKIPVDSKFGIKLEIMEAIKKGQSREKYFPEKSTLAQKICDNNCNHVKEEFFVNCSAMSAVIKNENSESNLESCDLSNIHSKAKELELDLQTRDFDLDSHSDLESHSDVV